LLPKLFAGAAIPFGIVVLPNALGLTSFVGFALGTVQYFWLPVKLEQSGASKPSFLAISAPRAFVTRVAHDGQELGER
jgi:hypothetical protein